MYVFFISPFFVLIYTPGEMNKNMIKTRTYKNTSQKLKGENWSRRGETEGSRFDVLKGIRHNFFLDNKCPILSSTLLKSQNHRGVTVLYRVSIGFYKRHKKWSLLKNSLFQGVFQNMNRCSIWWFFVPRVCNGVGIIVTKNWIESLLTVPIWDRKTFATERDRKFLNAGYACPLGRNSPSLVNHSYMRPDNQRQVQRGRRVPDAPKYIRQTRWFL